MKRAGKVFSLECVSLNQMPASEIGNWWSHDVQINCSNACLVPVSSLAS